MDELILKLEARLSVLNLQIADNELGNTKENMLSSLITKPTEGNILCPIRNKMTQSFISYKIDDKLWLPG